MLPLGLRVQEKAEALIDKHMVRIGKERNYISIFIAEIVQVHQRFHCHLSLLKIFGEKAVDWTNLQR